MNLVSPATPSPRPLSYLSRHLVPRWCISANLRSLVLPLSFLPASPLVFLSLSSPFFPIPCAHLLISEDPLVVFTAADLRRASFRRLHRTVWKRQQGPVGTKYIPGSLRRLYQRDLIGPIRYSVATVLVCMNPPPRVSEF